MIKKIFISFLFSLVTVFSFGQFTNNFPLSGSAPTTRQTSAGGLSIAKMIQMPVFVDTTAANATGVTSTYIASHIFTTSDQNFWIRAVTLDRWIKVTNPAASIPCAGLLTGGIVTWNANLNFLVTAATYCINNIQYASAAGNVTLAAADPSLPRIDVIGVNTLGAIISITGTPNANPAKPQVDPFTQLELTSVLVPAGATTPSPPVTRTIIYNENLGQPTEWTASASLLTGTANFANTTFPYIGTIDCLTSDSAAGTLNFATADTLLVGNYDVFQMFIRLTNTYPTAANISVQFTFEGVAVSNLVTLNNTTGFLKNVTGAYQNVSIAMANMGFTSGAFNGLTIRLTNKGASLFLDYVQLQSGIIPPISDLDKRYWKLFIDDTTYSKHTITDTLRMLNIKGNFNRAAPSPPIEWVSASYDTVNSAFIPTKADLYTRVVTGAAVPNFGFNLDLHGGSINFTAIGLNSDKSINFGNGINFIDNRLIAAGNTITVTPSTSTGIQLRLPNVAGTLASTATMFSIETSSSTLGRAMQVLRSATDTVFQIKPQDNIGIGNQSYNRYVDLYLHTRGRGFLADTMNTVNRNGINRNITGTAITLGGSGILLAPRITATNCCGGRPAVFSCTVSGGALTSITIIDPGSSYFAGASLVVDTTGCTIGTGNVLPTATFTAGTGTLPYGIHIINTDSTSCPAEWWNGSAWVDNCEGSGGGGGVGTFQQVTDAGNETNTPFSLIESGTGNDLILFLDSGGGNIQLFTSDQSEQLELLPDAIRFQPSAGVSAILRGTNITGSKNLELPNPPSITTRSLVLSVNGNFADNAGDVTISAGSGTVTSVGFTAPTSLFTVSGSPITTSGTIAGTLTNANAGTLWGNNTGSSAAPSYTRVPVLGLAGTAAGTLGLSGATSGVVTVQTVAAAGTYNFNLPTSAGTTGLPLLSGGGGSTAQTYGVLGISGGGTNNGSLSVTNQNIMISDGSKIIALPKGANGTHLIVNGSGNLAFVDSTAGGGAGDTLTFWADQFTITDDTVRITGTPTFVPRFNSVTGLMESSSITDDGSGLVKMNFSGNDYFEIGVGAEDYFIGDRNNNQEFFFSTNATRVDIAGESTGVTPLHLRINDFTSKPNGSALVLKDNGSGETEWGSVVTSGTYTPTISAGTNATGTGVNSQWIRVGNIITVDGVVAISIGLGTGTSNVLIELPIASTFAAATDLNGNATTESAGIARDAYLNADTGTGTANLVFNALTLSGGVEIHYHFSYTVL